MTITKQYIYTFKNGETSHTVDCESKGAALTAFKKHFERFADIERLNIKGVSQVGRFETIKK